MAGIAMTAFAANSILCRAALGPNLIDPATFTTVRVTSAAVVLACVVLARRRHLPSGRYADWHLAPGAKMRICTLPRDEEGNLLLAPSLAGGGA